MRPILIRFFVYVFLNAPIFISYTYTYLRICFFAVPFIYKYYLYVFIFGKL